MKWKDIMRLSKRLLIFLFIIILLAGAVHAENNEITDNQADNDIKTEDTHDYIKEVENNDIKEKTLDENTNVMSSSEDNSDSDGDNSKIFEEAIDSQCCSSVLQVSETESLISFRCDSTGSPINIIITNNSSFVKQYKTYEGYFFHVLVSKDAWLVGTGGADDDWVNRLIEKVPWI